MSSTQCVLPKSFMTETASLLQFPAQYLLDAVFIASLGFADAARMQCNGRVSVRPSVRLSVCPVLSIDIFRLPQPADIDDTCRRPSCSCG